uniref:ShKT domain-containing protein n=1 Tax=Panagrolaimus sp. PS1159 TaxID=55785 RepID=A0AC35F1X3_9BILA
MFFGLFLLGLFVVNLTFASKCAENDISKVNTCFETFQHEIFEKYNISHLMEYYAGYKIKTKEWEGIEEICNALKPLQKCLGKEIIENCINYNDFSFDKSEKINRFYVSHFLQIDYYCSNGYEILKNNFDCLMKDVKMPLFKNHKYCDARLQQIEIKTYFMKMFCESKEAACFTKTFETFELCSMKCKICKNLNKVTVEKICDDIFDGNEKMF